MATHIQKCALMQCNYTALIQCVYLNIEVNWFVQQFFIFGFKCVLVLSNTYTGIHRVVDNRLGVTNNYDIYIDSIIM